MNRQLRKARKVAKEMMQEEMIRREAGLEDATVVSVNNASGLVKRVLKNVFELIYGMVEFFYCICGIVAVCFIREGVFEVIKGRDTRVIVIGVIILLLYICIVVRLVLRRRKKKLKKSIVGSDTEENVIRVEKNTAVKAAVDVIGFILTIAAWLVIYILAFIGIIALVYMTNDVIRIFLDAINQVSGAFGGGQ